MAVFDPAGLKPVERYRLLVGTVVPRPIAWVSTLSAGGAPNLAPFSFFNGVTASPPVLMVCIAHRDPVKDTLANLRATREAVVHIVPPGLMEACHQTGGEYQAGVSEAAQAGLELLAADLVKPARLRGAQIAFECRLLSETPVGEPATALCLLEAVRIHVDDALIGANGMPDPARVRAAARLGERAYLRGDTWQLTDLAPQQVPEGLALPRRR